MQKYIKLSDGNTIPIIGLGTWQAKKDAVGNAISFAINKSGYRHIDCASIYGNEKEIGEALANTLIKRKELFITSKLWNTDHKPENVEKACKKTLSDLKLDHLDLYLIHWGVAFKHGGNLEPLNKDKKVITDTISIQQTWQAMEGLVKKGLVKSIGVANFTTMMLVDLLTYAVIKPVINQIELHPYNTQEKLVSFCKYKNIAVTAYSPLGHGDQKLFKEAIIENLAYKYKKTPTQILLNWAINRGTIAISKSITPERISENIEVFDFTLTIEEQAEISSLNKNQRYVDPFEWWAMPYFS